MSYTIWKLTFRGDCYPAATFSTLEKANRVATEWEMNGANTSMLWITSDEQFTEKEETP